jgi:hypothetical protein
MKGEVIIPSIVKKIMCWIPNNGKRFTNDHKALIHPVYEAAHARGGSAGSDTALQVGRSRVRFPMVSQDGVYSASNRNEYQKCFLRGKGGRCLWLHSIPPSSTDCLEI